MSTPKRAAEQYRAGNLESARMILENIAKCGGDSVLAQWARLVVARSEAPPDDAEAGPLFAGRAA
jgi:hypothetical protein